jgi:adenylosuccinate synthase
MPATVVVGGQFGSEGKGKVALAIVRQDPTVAAVIRVGGPNSGHTVVTRDGKLKAFRQIPAAAIDGGVAVVLPPGSYIDVPLLLEEAKEVGLTERTLLISPFAQVITPEQKRWEEEGALSNSIGSTGSGTGAAVMARVARHAANFPLVAMPAEECSALQPYIQRDTTAFLRNLLEKGRRVLIEGTQGFGLSVLHGNVWPKATSRDTSAAAFISEVGISPLDVDDVTLVIRAFPIRVAGDSGPLIGETTWDALARETGLQDLREYTTVTRKLRRVGRFDPGVVLRALQVNRPTRVVMNHVDYVDPAVRSGQLTAKAEQFLKGVELSLGRGLDWVGFGADHVAERGKVSTQ